MDISNISDDTLIKTMSIAFVVAVICIQRIRRQNRTQEALDFLRLWQRIDCPQFNEFRLSTNPVHMLFHTNLEFADTLDWLKGKIETYFKRHYRFETVDAEQMKARFAVLTCGHEIHFELSYHHQNGAPYTICMLRPR